MKDKIFIFLQYIIPHSLTSRLVSKLAESKNKHLKNYLINLAIKNLKSTLARLKKLILTNTPLLITFL